MAWEWVYIYPCMELASESVWALGLALRLASESVWALCWGLRLASELVCHHLA